MTSKFTPIVKVRQQEMDKIETLLVKARYQKRVLEENLVSLMVQIEQLEEPKSGTIALMSVFMENLTIIRREKNTLEEKLLIKKKEVLQFQEQYKKAHVEYEKIKYLEQKDFEETIKKIKKQEQLDMDEISNMLFVNKG